ncbi:xanthine dehydrogenase family protein molybdopterin-binding subunit [Phenylobacterium sp. LjRoot225]|uniref:xanthine dehydrogenase family protein molybdopterin-binding subunit n=1 Tax=Phenylobacterium sp. LjRoot225 TaxID=3342285 RepID=UPI003ED04226
MNAPRFAAPRFIGQRMPRKEDARLLTGRGAFVDDVILPGLSHVAFVRSPIARGRILSIDLEAARALPGVRAIYTAEDLAPFDIEMLSFFLVSPPPGPKVYPLARDRVAYVGDPVAMVIAEDRYIAEDAAGLVMVDYDPEAPAVTLDDARRGAPVHPEMADNIAGREARPDPELEQILATAPHRVTGTIRHQRICQSPMETRGIVVSKNGEEEITVYISCQSPPMVARHLSLAFGLPATSIRVIAKDVGGSFGLKVQPWREEMAVVAAGMILGRPLKWIEDRLENLTTSNLAREQEITLRLAFDEGGRLLGAHADYAVNNGAYPHFPDANLAAMMFMWPAYKQPRFGYVAEGLYTNTIGLGGYRGPWAIESLAREAMLDVAARQIGLDPIEIRRRNLVTAADQPYADKAFGFVLEDITPSECLDALLEKVDVAAFRAEQAAARGEGRYLGLGVAAYIEPTAVSSMSVLASDVAHLRIEPTGKVTAVLTTHSQGHGTQTTMAQVIAERLGVPFEDVSVFEDDSSRSGYGAGAAGSRQAVAGGGASIRAAEILVAKVKRVAAHLLNASPEEVRIEDGVVRVTGVQEMTRSLREIAEVAYNEPARLPPDMEPGLEAQYRYSPPPVTWTSAAHACIVEVDAETGFVDIRRWVCSEDCGVMINPAIVEGQIAGGLAQAIGEVLLEEAHFDDQGNPTAVTFKDYMLPAAADVPEFEFTHIVTPSKSEGGFRGVGEGGAIIGPPTLVNAIADALAPFGARCLDLPLTPSKLLKLMSAGRGRP